MTSKPTGIEAKSAHSYSSIEGRAAQVREVLGLQDGEPANMREIFEFSIDDIQVGLSGKHVPLAHGVEELTTEALTQWNAEEERVELILSEEWYRQLCGGHPRAAFTVGHELGHAVLHTATLVDLGDLNLQSQAALHRGKKEHSICRDTEWQANSFAAAFLMPFEGLKSLSIRTKTLSEGAIASHFGVSLEAAFNRLDVVRRGKLGSF
jgi:hypothetical protein